MSQLLLSHLLRPQSKCCPQSDLTMVWRKFHRGDALIPREFSFSHVIALGHSYGGTTAARFCEETPRCRGTIPMDGPLVISKNFQKPILYISSFSPDLSLKRLAKKGVPSFYSRLKRDELVPVKELFKQPPPSSFWVRFPLAGHLDLTDLPWILPFMSTSGHKPTLTHRTMVRLLTWFVGKLEGKETQKPPGSSVLEWLRGK